MRLAEPPRTSPRESVVPMINVVFLLLIFFLMSATLADPDPFELRTPEAQAGREAAGEAGVLFVSASGEVAFGSLRGEAALGAAGGAQALRIRADQGVEASRIAALIARLSAAGVTALELEVRPQ